MVFSIASRWIFSRKFINSFDGKVLNLHSGYLPRERGSTIYSKIMNDINVAGVSIHLVTPKIDAGAVLFKKKIVINTRYPTILCHTRSISILAKELFGDLLKSITSNAEVFEESQDIGEGIFMPQPYTKLMGSLIGIGVFAKLIPLLEHLDIQC